MNQQDLVNKLMEPDSTGTALAAYPIAILSAMSIVVLGIPWICSSYLTGVAGETVPLGYFVGGIRAQPIPGSLLRPNSTSHASLG